MVSAKVAKGRVERRGGGNGRAYQIHYTASDPLGESCSGSISVTVPHDQDGMPAVDDGQTINSLTCMPAADVNGDGTVSFADITMILGDWGKFGPDETLNWPDGDANFDGGVYFSDITAVLGQWGMSTGTGDWQPVEP